MVTLLISKCVTFSMDASEEDFLTICRYLCLTHWDSAPIKKGAM